MLRKGLGSSSFVYWEDVWDIGSSCQRVYSGGVQAAIGQTGDSGGQSGAAVHTWPAHLTLQPWRNRRFYSGWSSLSTREGSSSSISTTASCRSPCEWGAAVSGIVPPPAVRSWACVWCACAFVGLSVLVLAFRCDFLFTSPKLFCFLCACLCLFTCPNLSLLYASVFVLVFELMSREGQPPLAKLVLTFCNVSWFLDAVQ